MLHHQQCLIWCSMFVKTVSFLIEQLIMAPENHVELWASILSGNSGAEKTATATVVSSACVGLHIKWSSVAMRKKERLHSLLPSSFLWVNKHPTVHPTATVCGMSVVCEWLFAVRTPLPSPLFLKHTHTHIHTNQILYYARSVRRETCRWKAEESAK